MLFLSIGRNISFSVCLETTTSECSLCKQRRLWWCCMKKVSLNLNRALFLNQMRTAVAERQHITRTVEIWRVINTLQPIRFTTTRFNISCTFKQTHTLSYFWTISIIFELQIQMQVYTFTHFMTLDRYISFNIWPI